jgi:hypothetical protein
VYVDGFNLLRRALQGRDDRKWLDLEQLCRRLLPTFDVQQIRYFTARVRHVEGKDPRAPQNQEAYLRALGTCRRCRCTSARSERTSAGWPCPAKWRRTEAPL